LQRFFDGRAFERKHFTQTRVNSMTTLSNGQVRKSLASQIDRLDAMLDGLADGLNELVISAVKQAVEVAVKEAVRSVLSEVLANPDLLSKLQGAVNVPAPISEPTASRVSLGERLCQVCSWIGRRIRAMCQACGEKVLAAKNAVGNGCGLAVERCKSLMRKAGHGMVIAWQRLQIVRTLKYQMLTALTVGALCGTGVFFAGPWVGAIASGIGGFGTSCAVQMGIWVRRMLS
jgi:hypothetical protein